MLTTIEPESGPFDALLAPFRAMVSRQERFVNEVGARRHRRVARVRRPSHRETLAARLSRGWDRLVCVQGDSNAWPRRDPARQPPEIVHWVAHRPATGEILDVVLAPRRPLAPATAAQTELSARRILEGCDLEAWRTAWREFVRPDDLPVTWGGFYAGLAVEEGLSLPGPGLDLRAEVLALLRAEAQGRDRTTTSVRVPDLRAAGSGRLRTVDACAAILGVDPPLLGVEGRAGRRLAALAGVLAALAGRRSPGDPGAGRWQG